MGVVARYSPVSGEAYPIAEEKIRVEEGRSFQNAPAISELHMGEEFIPAGRPSVRLSGTQCPRSTERMRGFAGNLGGGCLKTRAATDVHSMSEQYVEHLSQLAW